MGDPGERFLVLGRLMADDVTIPGTGSKVPKWAAYGGVAVVGVLVIMYYRNKQATAATAAAPTVASQYPPDGTTGNPADPYSTDPATGQTYGNEIAGSGGTFGAFTGTSSDGTGTVTQPYQTAGGPPFSNNSAWADWVIQELEAQQPGIDVATLTDAIGLYLNGQPMSAAERAYVFDAIAIAGDPPVAGPAGYPPKLQGNGSTGGTGGTPTGAPTSAPGLSVTGWTGYADFGWNPIPGASSYTLEISGHASSSRTEAGNHAEHVTLAKGAYSARVRAVNSSGTGPWSAPKSFTVR